MENELRPMRREPDRDGLLTWKVPATRKSTCMTSGMKIRAVAMFKSRLPMAARRGCG